MSITVQSFRCPCAVPSLLPCLVSCGLDLNIAGSQDPLSECS